MMPSTRAPQLLALLLLLMSHDGLGMALGGSADRESRSAVGDQQEDSSQEQLMLDEREAEMREQLMREYEAMQLQERNAYLVLLLDKLRSIPPLVPAAAAAADYRPLAPPSPPQQMPVAAALQQQLYRSANPEEKKSNYISYCHFKICNMGKRKYGARLQ